MIQLHYGLYLSPQIESGKDDAATLLLTTKMNRCFKRTGENALPIFIFIV
jgi:hypothetical protein